MISQWHSHQGSLTLINRESKREIFLWYSASQSSNVDEPLPIDRHRFLNANTFRWRENFCLFWNSLPQDPHMTLVSSSAIPSLSFVVSGFISPLHISDVCLQYRTIYCVFLYIYKIQPRWVNSLLCFFFSLSTSWSIKVKNGSIGVKLTSMLPLPLPDFFQVLGRVIPISTVIFNSF